MKINDNDYKQAQKFYTEQGIEINYENVKVYIMTQNAKKIINRLVDEEFSINELQRFISIFNELVEAAYLKKFD